jgi:hypothetical protein
LTDKKKLFHYDLRALPTGKFQFLPVDSDDPRAPKRMSHDMTETEVREVYRTQWGYSDAEIDKRLWDAREKK